ncbi:CAP domain-containing protein [Cellulomonas telluris]|uniref:CAP domain-containing protein n=1 Tax=Cellulomonas telluris TaxID=2306636 RepID=UPI0010A8A61D|nr:CAP domain-containing protein [Cellulomonas telluris]
MVRPICPHVLHALALLALLVLLAACGSTPGPRTSPTPTTSSAAAADPLVYAAALVASTNEARDVEGLPALAVSECAERAAADRAQALVGEQELEHAPLDGVLRDCAPSAKAAENLSRATAPAADVVDAWLGSPGHRDNLLDPDLREVGVACVEDAGRLLCAQVFLGP